MKALIWMLSPIMQLAGSYVWITIPLSKPLSLFAQHEFFENLGLGDAALGISFAQTCCSRAYRPGREKSSRLKTKQDAAWWGHDRCRSNRTHWENFWWGQVWGSILSDEPMYAKHWRYSAEYILGIARSLASWRMARRSWEHSHRDGHSWGQ